MGKYSDETRAVVVAALLQGQSAGSVASEYHIPETTVRYWRDNSSKILHPKKEIIGDLILEYLIANLETLKIQAEMFRKETWLNRQSASEAAVLHGVMTDKAIRLLEALSKARDNAAPDKPAES